MLAKKIIESLNVSLIYFIVAFNLSQKLPFIAGIRVYDCKPIQLVYNKQLKAEEKDRTIIMRNGVEYIFALKEDKEKFTNSGKYDVKKEFWEKKYGGMSMPDFEYKIGDKIIFPHGKSFEDFIKQMPSRVNKQVNFECFFLENKKQNADKKTYYNKKDMANDIKIMKDCFSIRIV